ncbi:DoxX family protein [Smaragdicoccus niigatensis]|uniref:DoxX family protein n=1 Tax=Smaragdicoccus niigatensis TaxID=359359 RepID=UPI00037F8C33|nr:DoxX family protein [Smaragdicoccus niigatensis]
MSTITATRPTVTASQNAISSKARKAGWILSGLVTAFLLADSLTKLAGVEAVRTATAELGIPVSQTPIIGATLLVCIAFYVFPRTSILGAVMLTGYFGGAIEVHMINQSGVFGYVLAPVYFAIVAWVGLYLRDERTRTVVKSLIGR